MEERTPTELDHAMARLADGDRSACPLVFSLLWTELVRFAERVLGQGAEADDVAQLAIEKIFAQASAYDSARPAIAWAFAIAAWECKTALRRRSRRREAPLESAYSVEATGPSPEQASLDAAVKRALDQALHQLSPGDRATLEEAVSEEGASRSPAFRKRKERALSRLRLAWRRVHGE